MPNESPTVYSTLLPFRSNSMCQVSFAEPDLLRRARDRKRASAGFSREHPGAAAGAAVAPAGGVSTIAAGAAGWVVSSWCSDLRVRAVSLPPGTHEIQPRLFLKEDGVGIVLTIVSALSAVLLTHCRHQPPADADAPPPASCGRKAPWPGRARARRRYPRAAGGGRRAEIEAAGQQSRGLFGRERRDPGFKREQAGEQAVEPGALLGAERRRLGMSEGSGMRCELIRPPRRPRGT